MLYSLSRKRLPPAVVGRGFLFKPRNTEIIEETKGERVRFRGGHETYVYVSFE